VDGDVGSVVALTSEVEEDNKPLRACSFVVDWLVVGFVVAVDADGGWILTDQNEMERGFGDEST
jgi:hypothetical protein